MTRTAPMSAAIDSAGPSDTDTSNTAVFRRIAQHVVSQPVTVTAIADLVRRKILDEAYLSDNQCAWLIGLMNARRAEIHSPLVDYVGPAAPKAVIVGDEPGTKLESFGAFTPWNHGCGDHLLTALDSVGLSVDSNYGLGGVGLVNSRGTDIMSLYVKLGAPRLIAAGRLAYSRLDALNAPISGYVNHPQYEKRFKFREVERYGRDILEATMKWGKR